MIFYNNKKIFEKSREIENPIQLPSQTQEGNELVIKNFNRNKRRISILLFLFLACFAVLAGRTFFLQIVKGKHYKNLAENNRIREIVIKAPRGLIEDKNGTILAKNIPGFDLVFVPFNLPSEKEPLEQLTDGLSKFIPMDKIALNKIFNETEKKSKDAYLLKENISYEQALSFIERGEDFPGIYLERTAKREYPDGEIFSFVIGYIGKINSQELKDNPDYLMTDYIGKNGLEYSYEKWLKGKHGQRRVEVDSGGDIQEELGITNPQSGSKLILNINADLQKKAYEILKKTLEENQEAKAASLVAINPQNGGVMAMVNFPSYNNNLFSEGISQEAFSQLTEDERKPLLNRAASGEYPPGSIFKPMIAAAALEEKTIAQHTTINCPGNISIGQWNFPDWKAHGVTDVKKAIAESCDVFFYSVGGGWEGIKGLGMNKMKNYVNLFGPGNLTGVDIPGESAGNVPNTDWKFKKFGERWYVGDDYHAAIGQGFITVTPIQMASATAAIANGGTFYRPQAVDKIINPDGTEDDLPAEAVNRGFISSENIEIVREGMRETVMGENGSGRSLASIGVETGGKTGTAQFGNEDKTHSWYISFGPYQNPEIAMAVLIEGGGEGHDWAVPVTKEIYEWYFSK